ncbi:MAG TPA: HAMP domain-containing protein [Phototrophicaceae bacterium]|nr:HAMP domain-containing protein [Phototrophicaceae bacterium]
MTTETPQKKRGLFIKIQLKLAIVFTLLFVVVFAIAFLWFYNFATNVAKTRIGEALTDDLNAGAARIDGDEFIALYNQGQPALFSDRGNSDPDDDVTYSDDPRYWQIADWLHTLRTIDPNAEPWTFVRADVNKDPTGFYYVVDGLAEDKPLPDNTVNFKEHDTATDGKLFTGLTGTAVYLDDIYEWENKWYVSGYAPIKDSKGNVVGGLGIDYSAQYIVDVENQIQSLAIPILIVTYLIVFVLVYVSSRFLSAPISRLTAIAEHIGEGNYDQDFTSVRPRVLPPDEIDTLADVFQIMIGKVAKREEKLKQQVAELQIQIDHSKRDEQVKEIVENDFFQGLQAKAFEMRSRRSQTQEPEKGS